MKPLIGISAFVAESKDGARQPYVFRIGSNYAEAVASAGGCPIMIPPFCDLETILPMLDGVLVPGGDDIDPKHFGEPLHPEASLQTELQYEADSSLLKALPPEMPFFGICYGCQILNVSMGGKMIQHIPDVPGAQVHTGGPLQTYQLEPDSKLAQIVGGDSIQGKSFHHQAIREPGLGLRVVGRAPDGIIEAVESLERTWTIGVQWHPERTQDDAQTRRLFESFVDAAAHYHQARFSRVSA